MEDELTGGEKVREMIGQGTGRTVFTELKLQRILTRVALGELRELAQGAMSFEESVDEWQPGGPRSGVIWWHELQGKNRFREEMGPIVWK